MIWTGWDVAITIVGGVNVVGLVVIGIAIRKLAGGPIAGLAGNGLALLPRGIALFNAGKRTAQGSAQRLAGLFTHLKGLHGLLNVDSFVRAPAGAAISYRSVANAFGNVQNARAGWATLQRRAQGKSGLAVATAEINATAKTRRSVHRRRPSLALRLGLIPPAARHLSTILRVVKIARSVLSALPKRGPV